MKSQVYVISTSKGYYAYTDKSDTRDIVNYSPFVSSAALFTTKSVAVRIVFALGEMFGTAARVVTEDEAIHRTLATGKHRRRQDG